MIGQDKLIQSIDKQIEQDTFARFTILVGDKGSGKKTVANYIADKYQAQVIRVGVGIDDIRTVIKNAYKNVDKTFYIIADADKMSKQAQNAMLKVVEEPPNQSYFILTLQDESNTLETIISRACVLHMEYYTPEQLLEFCKDKVKQKTDEPLIVNICSNPGEVTELINIGVDKFYNYVEKVVDNIAEVSGANSFKIAEQINLKDNCDKYDLKMFWKAFVCICGQRGQDSIDNFIDRVKYFEAVKITSASIADLNIKGINKSGLFDLWILDIRKAWMQYGDN